MKALHQLQCEELYTQQQCLHQVSLPEGLDPQVIESGNVRMWHRSTLILNIRHQVKRLTSRSLLAVYAGLESCVNVWEQRFCTFFPQTKRCFLLEAASCRTRAVVSSVGVREGRVSVSSPRVPHIWEGRGCHSSMSVLPSFSPPPSPPVAPVVC